MKTIDLIQPVEVVRRNDTAMMKAMVFESRGGPLVLREVEKPRPGPGQVLVKVHACGVCRTDLHIMDGDLPNHKHRLIPGHEVAGVIESFGDESPHHALHLGQPIGIPWLGWTCGRCSYCHSGRENLCDRALFTGYTLDGGYAEYMVADERYCFRLPANADAVCAAPLLCAGLIGFRSLVKAGPARRLGLYGFGAAGHIVIQMARRQGREVYAFTRPGDAAAQQFALSLGAAWAGGSDEDPPCRLDASIIFAPVGELVPVALRALAKGGIVVCGGIHMSDIPAFPYADLWQERSICSVANLTREDGRVFLEQTRQLPAQVAIERFPLEAANEALERLRRGQITGAAVLVP